MELTLGEKAYLSELIRKYFPQEKNSYEIAEAFTRPQRQKLLMHYRTRENKEAREMIENIRTFQTKLI